MGMSLGFQDSEATLVQVKGQSELPSTPKTGIRFIPWALDVGRMLRGQEHPEKRGRVQGFGAEF